jgi:hypothetical protein
MVGGTRPDSRRDYDHEGTARDYDDAPRPGLER